MKLASLIPVSIALAAALVAGNAHARVSVTLENQCDKTIEYKIEKKESTLDERIGARGTNRRTLDIGDKIKVGDKVVHTVSAASKGKTVVVCQ